MEVWSKVETREYLYCDNPQCEDRDIRKGMVAYSGGGKLVFHPGMCQSIGQGHYVLSMKVPTVVYAQYELISRGVAIERLRVSEFREKLVHQPSLEGRARRFFRELFSHRQK